MDGETLFFISVLCISDMIIQPRLYQCLINLSFCMEDEDVKSYEMNNTDRQMKGGYAHERILIRINKHFVRFVYMDNWPPFLAVGPYCWACEAKFDLSRC